MYLECEVSEFGRGEDGVEFEVSEFGRGEDGGGDEFFAARMVVVMICHCADL